MSKTYDVIIVGSGTAGQTIASKLAENHLKIALVEQSNRPGGTCALRGCQAKKWFYEGAETIARTRHLAGTGIEKTAVASWLQLKNAKNEFTRQVPERTRKGLEKAGIDLFHGKATFQNDQTLTVGSQALTASWIVLATGAKPMPLPIDGAQQMIDSTAFLELEKLPQRVIFIGGGFVSFEFAHFAAQLGPAKSQITILEAGPRPLGPFDSEMVDLILKASGDEGINIHCEVDIASIESADTALRITLKDGAQFDTDLVVHGAGREPDIADLNLARAGIDYEKQGILVNAQMQTTNPRVFAVGDCVASVQLARVADYEAQVAAANIRHLATNHSLLSIVDYTVVPSLLFTYPQYAMVGATEDELIKKNVAYKKSFAKNLSWPTYQRLGMKNAGYKLLMGENGLLLGAHILSDNASGLLNTLSLAMANTIPMADLYHQSVLAPYPSRESDLHYMLKPFAS